MPQYFNNFGPLVKFSEMKPFKAGLPVAAWLLRALAVIFAWQYHWQPFIEFQWRHFGFYIHMAYLIAALFLIIGGALQKQALTVGSGLLLFVLPVVQLVRGLPDQLASVMIVYLIPLAVGFYFFAAGND